MIGSQNRVIGNCLRTTANTASTPTTPTACATSNCAATRSPATTPMTGRRRREGCGCTGGGKFWETVGAQIVGNNVHDNRGTGLWADTNNSGFLFQAQLYRPATTRVGIFYETSYNARIVDNVLSATAWCRVRRIRASRPPRSTCRRPAATPGRPGPTATCCSWRVICSRTTGPAWSAWENADRFAGSPANTSSGTDDPGQPRCDALTACSDPAVVASRPYLDDCRWKTQNLLVDATTCSASTRAPCRLRTRSPGAGSTGCSPTTAPTPTGRPITADVVAQWIAFEQNNIWRDNTYSWAVGLHRAEPG